MFCLILKFSVDFSKFYRFIDFLAQKWVTWPKFLGQKFFIAFLDVSDDSEQLSKIFFWGKIFAPKKNLEIFCEFQKKNFGAKIFPQKKNFESCSESSETSRNAIKKFWPKNFGHVTHFWAKISNFRAKNHFWVQKFFYTLNLRQVGAFCECLSLVWSIL